MRTLARANLASACLALGLLLVASTAQAQAKVNLKALVASVSTQGNQVDPQLEPMARSFKANGLAFTSYKLVSSSGLSLAPGQTESVKLPNGSATVSFLRQEANNQLRIKVSAPGSSSEYSMGPGGELYIDAGAHGGGKLFLILRR